MIRYVSTRSRGGAGVSFSEALLHGLAPDGGLYIPTHFPVLEPGTCGPFTDTARRVLGVWLGGVLDENRLGDLIEDAFNFQVPLVPLDTDNGLCILELFHGPTLSFKDFGARFLGRILGALAAEPVTILVATSGDTGSAVADGCSGIPGVRVVLLYPDGQVSPIQEQQLIVQRPGVTAVRVRGTFDDCQRLVKGAFSHSGLKGTRLTTANSINIGRLLPQMLYYIHASQQCNTAPRFIVPSGNLGNLTSGVMAAVSGMETTGFVAAHNENDFFPRWLDNPEARFAPSRKTLSNAMDVGAPSNFERLAHFFRTTRMRESIRGIRVSDNRTRKAMQDVWASFGYMADPHTSVGLAVIEDPPESIDIRSDAVPTVVLSTAHPAKFPEIVKSVTGRLPDIPPRLARLGGADVCVQEMDVDGDDLAELIRTVQ